MASKYANLVSSRSEYARALPNVKSGFRGVDFSSSPHQVELYRLPDLRNMYRDYRSDEGGALETIPGFRRLTSLGGGINGIFRWDRNDGEIYLAVHAGKKLYLCPESERDTGEWIEASGTLAENNSRGFVYNGVFYILDGNAYQKLTESDGSFFLTPVTNDAYVPVTWLHGEEYEQRNALTDRCKTVAYGNSGVEVGVQSIETGQEFEDSCVFTYATEKATALAGTSVRMAAFKSSTITSIESFASATDDLSNIEALAFVLDDNDMVFSKTSFEGFSNLSALYLICEGKGRIYFDFEEGEKIRMNKGGTVFFSGTCEDVLRGSMCLATLPPNVVVEQGESVVLDGGFKIQKGFIDSVSQTGLLVVAAYSELEEIVFDSSKIYLHNEIVLDENGANPTYGDRRVITVGDNVPVGEYWFCGTLTSTTGNRTEFVYRVEVVEKGAEDKPMPVTDVYNYAAKLLTFNLPQATETVISVKADGMDIGYGCFYDDNNNICAIGAMSLGLDDEIEVEVIATDYHITSSNASFLDANPNYGGTSEEAINGCTLCTVYDDRVFLSGNPALPNTVFYSQRNDLGVSDPTYFGVLNYFNDGIGWERVTALFSFSDTLCVTKENAAFYHQGADGDDIVTRIYPSTKGNAGLGSLGACCNFLDDPVMLTRSGVYGVNKETLTLERTLGRRSATIDARLLNEKNLTSAEMVEWEGYLCLFINGNVYMADSRAMYTDATGGAQYEWFFLGDVGTWNGGKRVFAAVTGALTVGNVSFKDTVVTVNGADYLLTETHEEIYFNEDEVYTRAFELDEENDITIQYAVRDGRAYAVYATGEITKEGNFVPARHPAVIGDRLYFGNERGEVFVFNNDKRGQAVGDEEVGARKIHRSYYTFAGHRIDSGFATRLDDCDVPHLCKTTSPRSLTVRAKIMENSAYSIAVLTDKNYVYEKAERFTASPFTFDGVDFNKVSFHAGNSAALVGREKEKRWIEKQYLFRDGGIMQPFGIYSVVYRYRIAGRIRE